MSDNVTPLFQEEEKKAPSLKKKWIIFLSIVALIIVLLVWFLLSNSTALDGVKRFFRYLGIDDETYGSLRFDAYGNCSYCMVDDCFAVASQSGLTLFSEGGSTLVSLSGNFKNPMLDAAQDMVLLYDVGGTRLLLADADGEVLFDLTTSGVIFDADLSEDGLCSVIYEGSDCYSVLDVYNEKGAKLYKHRSESAFLNTCAISPDGSFAIVTALGQEDISFHSSARIFSTSANGVKASFSFGSQVICDMAFLGDETVCAIGEESVFFFDIEGNLIEEYSQPQTQLAGYHFANNKVLVLFDHYDLKLGYDLYCLSSAGTALSSINLSAAPLHMSVHGRYICLTEADRIAVYNDSLALQSETKNESYTAALARSDGTALCIGNGFAELYIP